jgi:DNA-binding CsgD family transcriptional regulator
MSWHIVGREDELAAVERLLGEAHERFSALLLEGDAGIGKTTVFEEALQRAETNGFEVLACRPGASEATLSLAAVGDLLGAVPADVWEALPPPQRRGLDVALLRIEPGELPVDDRAIAAGFRSVVSGLAAERPVLLAVDDVQWLDTASAAILAFVLRRLGPERVAVLATHRLSEVPRLDVAAVARTDAYAQVQLQPLSLAALQRALRERLGVVFPRSTLVRVHTASNGNPFFALEIGRLLAERDATAAGTPLPVPHDVREFVRERVAAQPAATRDLLLAAALLAHPTVETLESALDRPLASDLEPATRAAIAAREGDLIAFAHPLHAAAVVAVATAAERRQMHRRLAAVVHPPEERARHLALAMDGPDEATARLIEEGAASARARGGLHAAAELLESARAVTPASDADRAHARGMRAAELHIHGGDRARARMLLEELLAERLAPSQRAEALRLLAELCYGEEDLETSERLLEEALEIGDDAHRSAPALLDLMYVTTQLRMDFVRAAELGRWALESLRDSTDGPLVAEALAYSAMTDHLAGEGEDWNKVGQALELEDPDRMAPIGLPARAVAGLLLLYAGRHAEARDVLETARKHLGERGDEANLATLLVWLSWLESRCGDFDAAGRVAEEAIACAELVGNLSMQRWAIGQRAFVDAHLGEVAETRRRCAEAELLDERGVKQIALWVAASLALLEVSLGDYEEAWQACRPLAEAVERFGVIEPVALFFLPDALEALVGLGHLDRAEALIDAFERRGRELDRAWALTTGGRCRALLLAARGDLAGALAALERALLEHERLDMPFERARTLMVKGVTERRIRRRTAARQSLEEAASEFERLGTRAWLERARDELDRLGGRRRNGGVLTPSEQRVVAFAAEGLSNKEIAARLVVTVHTVEVHLSRAYAKLGVRSRAQLARRLVTD